MKCLKLFLVLYCCIFSALNSVSVFGQTSEAGKSKYRENIVTAGYSLPHLNNDDHVYLGYNRALSTTFRADISMGYGLNKGTIIFSPGLEYNIWQFGQSRIKINSRLNRYWGKKDDFNNDHSYMTQVFGLGYQNLIFKQVGFGIDYNFIGINYFRSGSITETNIPPGLKDQPGELRFFIFYTF
jgi:hypothetical protein